MKPLLAHALTATISGLALTAATISGLTAPAGGSQASPVKIGGSQASPFKKGDSFFVVVVQNAGDVPIFRICSPGAQNVAARPFPGPELAPADRPRFETDAGITRRIEDAFRKQGRYKLAPTIERADYVFVAQAAYMAVMNAEIRRRPDEQADFEAAVRRNGRSSPPARYITGGGDEQPNTMTWIAAVVVPTSVYASSADDPEVLIRAKLWEGSHTGANLGPASPEDLVKQLDTKPLPPLASVPFNDDPERERARLAELRERERLMFPRLNGRTLCAVEQPDRARPIAVERAQPNEPVIDRAQAPVPSAEALSGQNRATFQTRVIAVGVPVVVTNAQGTAIGGLTASDFTVFEDDVPQGVDRVIADSERFTAALVIDTSLSMQGQVTDEKVAASAFIDALRPDDRALAATFDSRTWLLADVTEDKAGLRRAILHVALSGPISRLYDALDVVTTERLAKVAGRKALVVLTDGMDVGSRLSSGEAVQRRLEEADVPVYAVQFDSRQNAAGQQAPIGKLLKAPAGYVDLDERFRRATDYLRQLAQSTGGLFEPATTADAIVRAFRRAADDLRSQYVLYYYPSNQTPDGRYHRLRVEVNRPGVVVRARTGYRAPGGPR